MYPARPPTKIILQESWFYFLLKPTAPVHIWQMRDMIQLQIFASFMQVVVSFNSIWFAQLTCTASCHFFSCGPFSRAAMRPSIHFSWESKATLVAWVLKLCKTMTGAIAPWFLNLTSMNSFFTLWAWTRNHRWVAHWLDKLRSIVALEAWVLGTLTEFY